MIGHGVEIQGLPELNEKATGMLNGRPQRVAIGVIGRRQGAESKGIEGIGGMHVEVAKIGIALGIRRWAPNHDLILYVEDPLGHPQPTRIEGCGILPCPGSRVERRIFPIRTRPEHSDPPDPEDQAIRQDPISHARSTPN